MYIVTILSNRTKTHMHNNMLCPYCQLRQNYIHTMHTVRGQNQFTYRLYAYCQRTKPIHIQAVCILSEDKTNSHTSCMHTVREQNQFTYTLSAQNQFTYTLYAYCQRTKPIHIHTVCILSERTKPIHIHAVCILSGQKLIYKYTASINSKRTKPHSNVHCKHTAK